MWTWFKTEVESQSYGKAAYPNALCKFGSKPDCSDKLQFKTDVWSYILFLNLVCNLLLQISSVLNSFGLKQNLELCV